ncbi:MAG: hypothetical protein U1B30_01040 [Pseudomonadota bacterium]|nr:hypothetical protein [Pseudomonadota bacterium]
MNKTDHPITADDARAALDSIAAASNITLNSMRPPLWLILLCAVALGIKTAAMGLMINDNMWNSIQWGSYIVCCLSVAAWIITLRTKGITVKIVDVNITEKGIISALLICALLVASRAIYLQTGSLLFPYLAGTLNSLILAYGLHFGLRWNTKEKEKN